MFSRMPLVFLFVVSFNACDYDRHANYATRTDHQKIAMDKSEMSRVEFTIGAGELHVSSGAKELMEGDFTYNDPEFQPQIRYNNSSFRSVLQIAQHPKSHPRGNVESKWDVRLSEDVPMEISVKMGAGQSQLDIGKLALRSVDVEVGAGEVKLDLRGTPKHDYDVTIRGGVGEASVWAPRSARVIADATGGIGGIQVHGFEKKDSHYENVADPHAQVRIHLDVKGGIGAINLYSE